MEEYVSLEEPVLLVFEWIPFDINVFEELAEELEAKEKERGILLTDAVDEDPSKPIFERVPPKAMVSVTRYEFGKVIELESFLGLGEEKLQRERLGIRITDYGSVVYGLRIKSVCGSPKASLDKLSRIVFDVFDDTSTLMDSILSLYQRRVLNIIYPRLREEGFERRKYAVLIARRASPDLPRAENYLADPYGTEVRQVTGRVISAFELNGAKVLCGENGMLIIGDPGDLSWAVIYASLRAFEMFLNDMNVYLWMTWDRVSVLRRELLKGMVEEVKRRRGELARISSDISLLSGLRGVISYAIKRLEEEFSELEGHEALDTLRAGRILLGLKRRNQFLGDLFEAIRNEIGGVVMILNTHIEESLDRLNTYMYILSIVFGAFGVGEFTMESLLSLGYDPAISMLMSIGAMSAVAIGGWAIGKYVLKRGGEEA